MEQGARQVQRNTRKIDGKGVARPRQAGCEGIGLLAAATRAVDEESERADFARNPGGVGASIVCQKFVREAAESEGVVPRRDENERHDIACPSGRPMGGAITAAKGSGLPDRGATSTAHIPAGLVGSERGEPESEPKVDFDWRTDFWQTDYAKNRESLVLPETDPVVVGTGR